MTDAPTLFDASLADLLATPPRVRGSGPVTAAEAARRVGPRAGSQAAIILCALADTPAGLTGHEACERTGCVPFPYVATTRLGSLVKLGAARLSGDTRLTPSGCEARVYVVTDRGRWLADQLRREARQ